MSKVCLVAMDTAFFKYSTAFRRAFDELNLGAEIFNIPFFPPERLTSERLKSVRKVLKDHSVGRFLIFCPGTAEYFLKEADQLFVFSAYRGWSDSMPLRVIPHVWTNVTVPEVSHITWADKPPLRIGFMGSSYSNSRVANIVSRLPYSTKRWLLSGSYLRNIDLVARLHQLGISLRHINAFVRKETFGALTSNRPDSEEAELELVEAPGFWGTEQQKSQYAEHLARMTYVVCPRGIENFSIRVYEALKFGRVPVIIDTDMVLPEEIDWAHVSLRVPYDSLDKLYDIVRHDYNSRSGKDFVERQQAAFLTMAKLETMRWLKDLLRETIPRSQID